MALIKADSDNTFEGAIVYHGNDTEKNYVYKVNKKSMYVGTTEYNKMMNLWERRVKGMTWKKFMTLQKGQMVQFGTWKISDEEASRKEAFEKINEIKKTQKPAMSKNAEKQISLLYKNFITGKGPYRFVSDIGKDRVVVILFSKDEWAVLNINGVQFLYDLRSNLYIKFNKEIHKKGKEVLWPEREYEKEIEKAG